ncbi:MAG: CBS domain-containing protein, partial [Bdellovibrionaceae bacterium]|nr:CBS domain-containing protein [Pseudobdellovibrionaceae bacterium]
SIEKICKTDVVTVTKNQTLIEVAKLMRDHSIGDVVVVDENNAPTGLLTDRDIVVGALSDVSPSNSVGSSVGNSIGNSNDIRAMKVEDLMSDEVVCAEVDELPYDVAMKMRDNGVARMPVIDKDGRLCGIITSGHLFRMINEELAAIEGISEHHRESISMRGAQKAGKKQTGVKAASPNMDQPSLQ